MIQANEDIFKIGRIAMTTNARFGIPAEAFSCIVSKEPYKPTQQQWEASGRNTVLPKNPVVDAVFYPMRVDAWEESAYLNGKRPAETPTIVGTRRARAVNAKIYLFPLNSMAALGVGKNCATVENNTEGTVLAGTLGGGGGGINLQEEPDKDPLAALQKFDDTYVGAESPQFARLRGGTMAYGKAKVLSVDGDQVKVQLFKDDGGDEGTYFLTWVVSSQLSRNSGLDSPTERAGRYEIRSPMEIEISASDETQRRIGLRILYIMDSRCLPSSQF